MTVYSLWQQSLTYPAASVRKLANLWFPDSGDGVLPVGTSPLLVQVQTTPNMTVKVNPGWARHSGYLGHSDATTNVTIPTANASNPRIDLIVMRWRDTEAGDASSSGTLEVIQGTPNASPQPPSTTGMIVEVLGQVLVAAGTTSIAGGAITDKRTVVGAAWTNITPTSPFQAASAPENPQAVIFNGWVTWHGLIQPSSGAFATNTAITLINAGGIPTAFRPPFKRNLILSSSSAATAVRGILDVDGSLLIATGPTTGPYVDLAGLGTYPARMT